MGSGHTGAYLACLLDEAGHDVTIIDRDAGALARLPESFSGETLVGNAMDQDVLRAAGIEHADAFIAATSGDNRNIMASQIAQLVFHVPRVIGRIKDPNRASVYRELGIEIDCRTTAASDMVLDLVGA
jgi:trk system potassium uptake protein TrkA